MKKTVRLMRLSALLMCLVLGVVFYQLYKRENKRDLHNENISDLYLNSNGFNSSGDEKGGNQGEVIDKDNENHQSDNGLESDSQNSKEKELSLIKLRLAQKLHVAAEYIPMNAISADSAAAAYYTADTTAAADVTGAANETDMSADVDRNALAFTNWLYDKYGEDTLRKLDSVDERSIAKECYEQTGLSLYILLDEYMGIRNYEARAREDTDSQEVSITFAGDICLTEDGFVIDYYDTRTELSESIGSAIINQTNSADIFMINNEFSISERGSALAGKMYIFRAMPSRVNILKELGADIVSLANNHVYDFGAEAFSDTIKYLDEAGIAHVGGGNNRAEAEKVVYFEVNGIKIGFISASSAEKIRYTPQAEEGPGIFLMYDARRFLDVAADTAKRCDYVAAFVHWGTEDSKYYETYQHELAENLFGVGVDIIIGAHPHVLQGVEYIGGKPVVYSLGDFWFNGETKYTALININIGIDGLKNMNITPCLQSNYTTNLIEDEGSKAAFMQYVRELSSGCSIDENGIFSPIE